MSHHSRGIDVLGAFDAKQLAKAAAKASTTATTESPFSAEIRAATQLVSQAPLKTAESPTAVSTAATRKQEVQRAAANLGGSAALGIIGALLWRDHRVLGFLGASALGHSAFSVASKDYAGAVGTFGTTAAGIGGSLLWKNHPILGFLVGEVAGNTIMAAIPGTQTNRYLFKRAP